MERNTRMDKIKSLIPQISVLVFTLFVYFYLRFFYQESVFFDFDMPRVALLTQDFINNGSYLTSQSYVQESVWRNIPWGPSLIFFYSFFLKISADPIVVANLLTIFNYFSIILITYLGWRYFSPSVGVLSGILLATNPYLLSYSRIIYQPAPLVTFEVLAMLLTISIIRDRSKISAFLLPIVWVVLFQIYIPTYIFILISVVYLLMNFKQLNVRNFIFGCLFSLILLLPSIYYYVNNPIYIERFVNAPSLFTPPEKTFIERFMKVILSFINIPVGNYFKWQTGYAYSDFVNYFSAIKSMSVVISILFLSTIIYSFKFLFEPKKQNIKQLTFWWTVSVVFSLMILWVTDLVPRYFLISIPPSMLLISIVINDLMIKSYKYGIIKYLLFAVPVLISIYWSIFNIKYDNFVKDYLYPNGKMYDIAETPYLHFKRALEYIYLDSKKSGCNNYLVANSLNDKNTIWMETEYLLRFLYQTENKDEEELSNICRYYLVHRSKEIEKEYPNNEDRKYGPFFVIKENEVIKN